MKSAPYRSPRSQYDVIPIVMSFAAELATPIVTDVRTDTLPRLIYKDMEQICSLLALALCTTITGVVIW